MVSEQIIERRVLVFAIWMTLGTLGLCLVLQGLADDNLSLGLAGSAAFAAGFIAHLIVNAIAGCGFSKGEVAFGTAFVTAMSSLVVGGWAMGGYSVTDQRVAAVFMSVLLLGVLAYLTVKFGVKGLFSRFHNRHSEEREDA